MKTSLCANVPLNRTNFYFNLKSSLSPFFHRAVQVLLKVIISCIEILEQFNKIDIYLALYTISVEQELRI